MPKRLETVWDAEKTVGQELRGVPCRAISMAMVSLRPLTYRLKEVMGGLRIKALGIRV